MKSIDICYPSFRFDYVQIQESFENLVTIKLNNISTYDNMKSFFEYFKYLKRLNQFELQGDFIRFEYFIDGYKWEYLIRKYIPQLRVFKFFFILSKWSMLRTIENLIQSFKTDFWLNEKKWFINCDYRAFFDRTYLYTIPYMNKELKYSILCQQKSTNPTNESLYIEKLSIYSIKLEHLLFNDRSINTESITINQIDDSITYEQLSRFLNISSIKSIEFQSRINSRLFFDILKYHKTQISIKITDANLRDLLQRNTYHHHRYLNKINQLILTSRKDFRYKPMIVLTRKDLETLCYYCTNIKRLIIRGAINPLDLIYLLKKFKCLTFLMGTCYNLDELCNYNIRQWLINQRETTLDKRNFIWKWTEDILYIWID